MNNTTSTIEFAGESFSVIFMPDGRKAMTAEAIGTKLGYAEPRKHINNLFNRHRNEFKDDVDFTVLNLRTTEMKHSVAFFETGAIKVCMFARTPEGERYRDIFAKVLAGVAKAEEQLFSKPRRPYMTKARSATMIKIWEDIMDEPVNAERQAKDAAEANYRALLEEHVAVLKQNVTLLQERLANN